MAPTIRDRFASVSAPIEEVVESGISFDLAIVVARAGGLTGRTKTFTSAAGVGADSELSTAQKALVATAFAQALRPSRVYVIGANSTTPETYAEALTAAEAAGVRFFYVACESRTTANIEVVSDWCETRRKFFLAQHDDLTPVALQSGGANDISGNKKTAVIYHPTAAQGADVAMLASAAAVDIDTSRPAFNAPVAGVTAYTASDSDVTAALTANMAILLPLSEGASSRYPDPESLVMFSGERMTALVTKAWFEDRATTDLAQQYAEYAAVNRPWPGGEEGEAVAESILAARAASGLRSGHLRRRSDLPDGYRFEATYNATTFAVTVTGELGLEDGTLSISVTTPLTRG